MPATAAISSAIPKYTQDYNEQGRPAGQSTLLQPEHRRYADHGDEQGQQEGHQHRLRGAHAGNDDPPARPHNNQWACDGLGRVAGVGIRTGSRNEGNRPASDSYSTGSDTRLVAAQCGRKLSKVIARVDALGAKRLANASFRRMPVSWVTS